MVNSVVCSFLCFIQNANEWHIKWQTAQLVTVKPFSTLHWHVKMFGRQLILILAVTWLPHFDGVQSVSKFCLGRRSAFYGSDISCDIWNWKSISILFSLAIDKKWVGWCFSSNGYYMFWKISRGYEIPDWIAWHP